MRLNKSTTATKRRINTMTTTTAFSFVAGLCCMYVVVNVLNTTRHFGSIGMTTTTTTTTTTESKQQMIALAVMAATGFNDNNNNEHEQEQKHRPLIRAVIHMGIPKTGTTSIQYQSTKLMKELNRDGYMIPWKRNAMDNTRVVSGNSGKMQENQVNFAMCFTPRHQSGRKTYPCDPDLLLHGLDIAQRFHHSLFVSAERFSFIDNEGVHMLSSYLRQAWDDVTLIMYYRRFYSWLGSWYNQRYKQRKFDTGQKNSNNMNVQLWENSMDEIVTHLLDSLHVEEQYTLALYQRVSKQFNPATNIVVMNYHDTTVSGSDESLFCSAVPNATQTCAALRRNSKKHKNNNNTDSSSSSSSSRSSANKNVGMNLDYSDIVYYASQQKLNWIQIKNNQHMQQITNQVQNYIKNTLHIQNTLTSETMKRICVSKPIVDRLWTISLQAKRMFLLPPHTTTITTTTTATTSDNENDDDNEL